jgi:hypothetical protein
MWSHAMKFLQPADVRQAKALERIAEALEALVAMELREQPFVTNEKGEPSDDGTDLLYTSDADSYERERTERSGTADARF